MPEPAARVPVRYIGFRLRLLASLIDTVLLSLLLAPLLWALYGRAYFTLQGWLTIERSLAARVLLDYALPAAAVLLFWRFRGSTPGKMVIGAEIVDAATLGPPSNRQLLLRYAGYYLSLLPLGWGFLAIAFDPRKQGWHDKLARTCVIAR